MWSAGSHRTEALSGKLPFFNMSPQKKKSLFRSDPNEKRRFGGIGGGFDDDRGNCNFNLITEQHQMPPKDDNRIHFAI